MQRRRLGLEWEDVLTRGIRLGRRRDVAAAIPALRSWPTAARHLSREAR